MPRLTHRCRQHDGAVALARANFEDAGAGGEVPFLDDGEAVLEFRGDDRGLFWVEGIEGSEGCEGERGIQGRMMGGGLHDVYLGDVFALWGSDMVVEGRINVYLTLESAISDCC